MATIKLTYIFKKYLSDTLIVTNTSIGEQNSVNGISFYPNPFNDNLRIINSNGKEIIINLIDITGKTITNLRSLSRV